MGIWAFNEKSTDIPCVCRTSRSCQTRDSYQLGRLIKFTFFLFFLIPHFLLRMLFPPNLIDTIACKTAVLSAISHDGVYVARTFDLDDDEHFRWNREMRPFVSTFYLATQGLEIVHTATGAVTPLDIRHVHNFAFSPAGLLLVVRNAAEICEYEWTEAGTSCIRRIFSVKKMGMPYLIECSDKYIAVSAYGDKAIYVLDYRTGEHVYTISCHVCPTSVQFFGSDVVIYSDNAHGCVCEVDLRTHEQTSFSMHPHRVCNAWKLNPTMYLTERLTSRGWNRSSEAMLCISDKQMHLSNKSNKKHYSVRVTHTRVYVSDEQTVFVYTLNFYRCTWLQAVL